MKESYQNQICLMSKSIFLVLDECEGVKKVHLCSRKKKKLILSIPHIFMYINLLVKHIFVYCCIYRQITRRYLQVREFRSLRSQQ